MSRSNRSRLAAFDTRGRLHCRTVVRNVVLGMTVTGAPITIVEALVRWRPERIGVELGRKAVHVGTCAAILAITAFCSLDEIATVAVIMSAVLAVLRPTRIWRALYRVPRRSYGEIAFSPGIAVAALAAQDRSVFRLAVAVLGASDTLASLIGQRFGRRTIPCVGPKTVAGSSAFLASTLAITLVAFERASVAEALALAAASTFVELSLTRGLDNFAIPVAMVATATLVG